MDLVYWSARSLRRRGVVGITWVDGEIVDLASCKYYFIRVFENLMQNHINNISIAIRFNINILKHEYLSLEKGSNKKLIF